MHRRDFLRNTAACTALAGAGLWTTDALAVGRTPGPGDVVKVTHPGMMGSQYPVPAVAREMVHAAVKTLTGEDDVGRAFGRFVAPSQKVGIKVNCLAGRLSSTSREVAYAVVEGVRAAGVPDANIVIFDQYPWALLQARYLREQEGVVAVRTVHHDEVPNAFEDEFRTQGVRARFAKNFLWCDTVINVPVVKDHNLAGVTCAFKNIVCGVIDAPPHLHRTMNESLAQFWLMPEIQSRVGLIVCDASVIQYSNGPKLAMEFRKPTNSVYATTDPVAMDAIATTLVESARAEARLPPSPASAEPPATSRSEPRWAWASPPPPRCASRKSPWAPADKGSRSGVLTAGNHAETHRILPGTRGRR